MKTVLIVTGDARTYGSGHMMRMRSVALELRKKKIAVQVICARADEVVNAPLPFSVLILDRRDTAFNASLLNAPAVKIAVDNRGAGREQADLSADLLPHLSMNRAQYENALRSILLHPTITAQPCQSARAAITLCENIADAHAQADFPREAGRMSPTAFHAHLTRSKRPALYYGQSLFEALYLGKHVQLYPVSDYHKKLAVDLYSRNLLEPNLLMALDGGGLTRFSEFVATTWKKTNE